MDETEKSNLSPPEGLEPAVSGSSQSQVIVVGTTQPGTSVVGPNIGPEGQRHLGAALLTFADVSNAVSRIAVASWQDSQERISRLEDELKQAAAENRTLGAALAEEQAQRRLADQRNGQLRRSNRARRVLEIVGGAVTGAGLSLLLDGKLALGLPAAIVGIAAVAAGAALGGLGGDQ